MKIVINTSTFGKLSRAPLEILEKKGLEYSLNPHQRTLKQDEVIQLAKNADGIIAGVEPLNEEVLRNLTGLKVISRCGVGMDNVDTQVAEKLKIQVFKTLMGPTFAVSELTVAVILNLLRKVNLVDAQMKSGIWKKQMGNLLSGKKAGIVGFGSIGQKVSQLLQSFNVEVGYYDVCEIEVKDTKRINSLEELLGWADIVSFHMPFNASIDPLMGKNEIALMKKGSWLINLARGGIVDEQALYEALISDHLAGAALDVFKEEPYEGSLRELDNVILTPHVGSYAQETRVEMEIEAVRNLLKGLKVK